MSPVTEHSTATATEVDGVLEVNRAAETRSITSVAELKALADPLRMAILAALHRDAPRDLRILSVKELAAELGEPKTKLYRHVRQLEAAGLIRVAATRLVSGILEQRYQACQGNLAVGRGVMRDPGMADEAAEAVAFFLDDYRSRYLAHVAEVSAGADSTSREPYREPALTLVATTVSRAKAQSVRDRLREIMAELNEVADDSEDAVHVEVLVGFMSPD
jgi:DNA-binding transcriptional ArsR family regulator